MKVTQQSRLVAARGDIDYRACLNRGQYAAVTTGSGPVLVVAGAGSGKTRTLIYRLAWLVESGVDPEAILLLTFTRRAAAEMIRRAAALLDDRCDLVVGGTFHWLAHRLLRKYVHHLGYQASFTIIDRSDAEDVIDMLAGSLGLKRKNRRLPKKRTIMKIFSNTVNRGLALQRVLSREYPHLMAYHAALNCLWRQYGEYKRANDLMDFDDLLVNLVELLRTQDQVRTEIGARFQHILVDEYQDTNRLQAEIVHHLSRAHGNVMVVGDDSQAIYGFRGADYRNILSFATMFPGCRIFRLEENYRSTQPILAVANGLIAAAREKYTKCLHAHKGQGSKPVLCRPADEGEQARFVCERVEELRRAGVPLRQMAVLFRASYHSFNLEVALAHAGIPFVKYGGFKFVESAHVKDVLAHLRVLQNGRDLVSWTRLLRLVNGIGPKRSQEIADAALKDGWQAVAAYAALQGDDHGIHRLVRLFEEISTPGLEVSRQVGAVRRYYEPIAQGKFDDYPRRLRELEYLEDWTGSYRRLEDFLNEVALEPPALNLAEGQLYCRDEDYLTLSTIHSAKGLEWQTVFVIAAVDGRLPSPHAFKDDEVLEEERRLLYVAVTRAQELLYIIAPLKVFDRTTGSRNAELSLFVRELPPGVFAGPDVTPGRGAPDKGSQRFQPGDPVRHQIFGRGTIEEVVTDAKVRVRFLDGHLRLLNLRYASLEKVSVHY